MDCAGYALVRVDADCTAVEDELALKTGLECSPSFIDARNDLRDLAERSILGVRPVGSWVEGFPPNMLRRSESTAVLGLIEPDGVVDRREVVKACRGEFTLDEIAALGPNRGEGRLKILVISG